MPQRYNTGNERPSNAMKDLNDNALAFDDYMNSDSDTFIDRLGEEKDSLSGSVKKYLQPQMMLWSLRVRTWYPSVGNT